MQNFTEDLINALKQQVDRLLLMENTLYEVALSEKGDLKTIELWVQVQSQFRISALEVQKQTAKKAGQK